MAHFVQVQNKLINVDRIDVLVASGSETLLLIGGETTHLPIPFDEFVSHLEFDVIKPDDSEPF